VPSLTSKMACLFKRQIWSYAFITAIVTDSISAVRLCSPWFVLLRNIQIVHCRIYAHTHTHTHTHIYIYIYIYIYVAYICENSVSLNCYRLSYLLYIYIYMRSFCFQIVCRLIHAGNGFSKLGKTKIVHWTHRYSNWCFLKQYWILLNIKCASVVH